MPRSPQLLSTLTLLAVGCASPQLGAGDVGYQFADGGGPRRPQQRIAGIIGITELNGDYEVDRDLGEVVRDDDSTLPLLAANWQAPMREKGLDLGFEAGFSLGWESDREAIVIDTGTVLIVGDNSFRLFDVSAGAYASTYLGEKFRLYGGIGPLIQFAWVDIDLDQPIGNVDELDENGIGWGYYTRVGLEYEVQRSLGVGIVARWVDSEVDLGGRLGDVSFEAVQVGLVVSTGF